MFILLRNADTEVISHAVAEAEKENVISGKEEDLNLLKDKDNSIRLKCSSLMPSSETLL